MVEHIWTIPCSHVVVDQQSNNVSLHNVIEQLNLIGSPVPGGGSVLVPISIEVVSLWGRANDNLPCRGRARLEFLTSTDVPIHPMEYDIDLIAHERVRSITKFQGLSIQGPGRYKFRLQLRQEEAVDWTTVAIIPLQVVINPLPPSVV